MTIVKRIAEVTNISFHGYWTRVAEAILLVFRLNKDNDSSGPIVGLNHWYFQSCTSIHTLGRISEPKKDMSVVRR